MSTIFSKIINGEIPCHKIAEDDYFLSFLDLSPVTRGHALVIPKKETDYIFDMDDASLANLHVFAKRVAIAMKKAVPCKKIGMAVVGLEVPHAHIHLIPMEHIGDLSFTSERLKLTPDEFREIADSIASVFK